MCGPIVQGHGQRVQQGQNDIQELVAAVTPQGRPARPTNNCGPNLHIPGTLSGLKCHSERVIGRNKNSILWSSC